MRKFYTRLLATVVALLLAFSATSFAETPQRFWDVAPEHWAFEYIADLAERDVIAGYDNGSFQPNRTVSRAEWATMMVKAAGVTELNDYTVNFKDMPSDYWATPYVNAVMPYMTGYKDGTYRPTQAATREDVTVAMVLMKGYDITDVDYSYMKFSDTDSISNYAKAYVAVAVKENLIAGFDDGTFRGQDTLSRAQAATLLYRAFQHGSADKVIGGVEIEHLTGAKPPLTKDEEYDQQAKPDYSKPTGSGKPEDSTTESSPAVSELVKVAGIASAYDYASDSSGNIYYVNGEYIDRTNIVTGVTDHYQLLSDLDLSNEEMSLEGFIVTNMCYDNYENELVIQGKYAEINYINPDQVVNSFIIRSPGMDGNLTLVNAKYSIENGATWRDAGLAKIVAVNAAGNFITNNLVLDKYATKGIERITPPAEHWVSDKMYTRYARPLVDELYYIATEDAQGWKLMRYDYAEATQLLEFSADAYALTDNKLYTVVGTTLAQYNFSGKQLEKVNLAGVNESNLLEKIVVYKDAVAFYDTVSESFKVYK